MATRRADCGIGLRQVPPGLDLTMVACANVAASRYAFPMDSMSVRDRRMTLTLPCPGQAEYSCELLGLGTDKARTGASASSFTLCMNHSDLYEEIDRELVEEGWRQTHTAKPERLT
jgi:hypothetical protein